MNTLASLFIILLVRYIGGRNLLYNHLSPDNNSIAYATVACAFSEEKLVFQFSVHLGKVTNG